MAFRPQRPGDGLRPEESGAEEAQSGSQGAEEGGGKDPVSSRPVLLGAEDGIAGCAADAEQHAQPVDEAEYGDGEVEGGQAIGPQPVGHKEGIRQDGPG